MSSVNYLFSNGEVGLDIFKRSGNDKTLSCMVIENLYCNQEYVWASRGGSRFFQSIIDIQEYVSYKDLFLLKTKDKLYLYEKNILKLTITYTGKFNISSITGSVGSIASDVDGFEYGIGLYWENNFQDTLDWTDVSGTLSIPDYSGFILSLNKDKCFVTITDRKSKHSIELYSNSALDNNQIVYVRQYLNQLIFLTLDKDLNQKLVFVSQTAAGTTSVDFTYTLLKGSSYNAITLTSDGFLLSGEYNVQKFYTATNNATSVFKADNIRSLEFYRAGVELIECYQDIVFFKPIKVNQILMKNAYSGLDYSQVYCPHTRVATIKDIRAFDGSPVKFLILFDDGSMDVIHCFRLENNQLNTIISRFTYKNKIRELLSVYLDYFVYLAGDNLCLNYLNGEFNCDEYKKFFPIIDPIGPIDPIDPIDPDKEWQEYIRNLKNGGTGSTFNTCFFTTFVWEIYLATISENTPGNEIKVAEAIASLTTNIDDSLSREEAYTPDLCLILNFNIVNGLLNPESSTCTGGYGRSYTKYRLTTKALAERKIIKLVINHKVVFTKIQNIVLDPSDVKWMGKSTLSVSVNNLEIYSWEDDYGLTNLDKQTIIHVRCDGDQFSEIVTLAPVTPRADDPYIPSSVLENQIVRRYLDHAPMMDYRTKTECYFGYIIDYKMVVFNPTLQGNLLYDHTKDVFNFNMLFLGWIRPVQVEVNKFYFSATIDQTDFSHPDARLDVINVSNRIMDWDYGDSYLRSFNGLWRTETNVVPYVGIGSREQMEIFSANVQVERNFTRQAN